MTEEAAGLKEARGDGAEYFDDRAVFYLQHREQIDKWGNLRWDATQAAARYLESLGDQVAAISESWTYWSGPVRNYKCLMLCPPGVDVTDPPRVALGLGWHPIAVMPEKTGNNTAPFAGIYLDPEDAGSALVRSALDASDGEAKSDYQSSTPWPRYRFMVAPPMWWTDLDSYRRELIGGVTGLVQHYGKALERGVGESIRANMT